MLVETPISNEQAILNAAEELFLDKGYSQVSTTAIARKAGCSQAMVHYYYRSKENLFSLVFRNKIAPFLKSLMVITYEDIPFEERIEKRIRAHFNMLSANERMPMILLSEVLSNPILSTKMLETFRDLPLPLIAQLQVELDEAHYAGLISKTNSGNLIFQIVSLNITALFLKPVLKLYMNASDEVIEAWMTNRLEENIKIILNGLKPTTK